MAPNTLFGFGLFVQNSQECIPLTAVKYDLHVKGFGCRVTIEQTYHNRETTGLECVYGFPINDQAAVTGFTVQIDGRFITSQIKKKEEAFREYDAALQRGDGAYLMDQSDESDDTFIFSVGRLPPGKECLISISYVCTLESVTETKMRLVISTALAPRYKPLPHNSFFQSAGGVVPPEKYQDHVPYTATLKGHIEAIDKISAVASPSHHLAVVFGDAKTSYISFSGAPPALDRDLIIDVDIDNNPQYHVEVEKLADNRYVAMLAYVPKVPPRTVVNTELIFLVDCSGSMQGTNIASAVQAMQVFLRSIPPGCYFNFYRFGSSFHKLFPISQLYGPDTFDLAKKYAGTTTADLGGTEILPPLEEIFQQAPRAGFSRQLFILTDGAVTNTEQVISLVEKNADNTRVFAFGIGDSPSRSLVNGVAMAGNGKSEFIKVEEILEEKIGRHLNRSLQPAVLDATVTWNGVTNVQQVPAHRLPPVFCGDRQLVFAFFDYVEGSPTVSFQHGGETSSCSLAKLFELHLTDHPFLSKLAARALIKQIDTTPQVHLASKQARSIDKGADNKEELITRISLEHGVMSKYTSLIAVEERSIAERSLATEMQLRQIPVQKAGFKRQSPYRLGGSPFGTYTGCSSSGSGLFGGGGLVATSSHPPAFAFGGLGSLASSNNTNRSTSMFGCAALNALSPASPSGSTLSGSSSFGFGSSGGMQSAVPTSGLNFPAVPATAPSFFCPGFESASGTPTVFGSLGTGVFGGGSNGHEVHVGTTAHGQAGGQSLLSALLNLQQWDGTWPATAELEKLTKVSLRQVEEMLQPGGEGSYREMLAATLLAVVFIRERFQKEANVWQAMIRKAVAYLEMEFGESAKSVLNEWEEKVVKLVSAGI